MTQINLQEHSHTILRKLFTATERVLNFLYSVITGLKRTDHIRVADLAARAKLPSLNEVVTKQSAISAWRSQNGGLLDDILVPYDERTRGASLKWKRSVSTRCVAATLLLCGTPLMSYAVPRHSTTPKWQQRN